MSFGDSAAVFEQRAKAIGLADDVFQRFKTERLDTMAKFACACNYSPGASDDKSFKELIHKILGRDPSLVEEACMRRLYNESCATVAADIRAQTEQSSDDVQRKLAPADGASRLEEQQTRLTGLQIRGPYEPGDTLVDRCANLLAYKYHDLWLEKLMMCRLDSVPQGFSTPTFQQLEAADKRLFLLLAEKARAGIKATTQGRPCDAKFEDCMNSTEVLSILQPKPMAVRAKDDEQPLKRQKTEKPQFGNSFERPSNKGKGKGKTTQSANQFMRDKRYKSTAFLTNHAAFLAIRKQCDNSHVHLEWGYDQDAQQFATALEAEYPKGPCDEYAQILLGIAHSQNIDVTPFKPKMHPDKQQSGRSVSPLIPEYVKVTTILLQEEPVVDSKRKLTHAIGDIPAGSKLLRTEAKRGKEGDNTVLYVFGIFHGHIQFVRVAKSLWHPFDELRHIPDLMIKAIFEMLSASKLTTARKRLHLLQQWRTWAAELRDEERSIKLKMPAHVR
eukprot:s4141_g3.t1